MRKSKEPACKANPRLCKEAPNNRLADAIRTPILKWPGPAGLRKRLNTSVASLAAAVKQYAKGNPVRERAICEYLSCMAEVDLIFRDQEAALTVYAGQIDNSAGAEDMLT